MSAFHDCLVDLGAVLLHDYRYGHAHDLSPSGLTSTYAGGQYRRRPAGEGYVAAAGTPGAIVVADTGAGDPLRLTEGTLMVFGDELNPSLIQSDERLISKHDAGGTNYELMMDSGSDIFQWYDGVNTRSTAVVDARLSSVAVPFSHGGTPTLYGDGGDVVEAFSGVIQAVADDADLQIGRLYTGSAHLTRALHAVTIFPTQLTPGDIAETYAQWLLSRPPGAPRRRLWSIPRHPLAVAQYGGTRTLGEDANGNDAIVVGEGVTESNELLERGVRFPGKTSSYLRAPAVLDMAAGTVAGWVRTDDTGAFVLIGHVRLAPVDSRVYAYSFGGGAVITGQLGTSALMTSGIVAQPNTDYYVSLRWDASDGYLDVNGVQVATEPVSGMNASLPIPLGALPSFAYESVVGQVELLTSCLTEAEVRSRYLLGARKVLVEHPRYEYPEMPDSLADPAHIGPHVNTSGSHWWLDDGAGRYLKCDLTGNTYLPQHAAFGTWRLTFNIATATSALRIGFIQLGGRTAVLGAGVTCYYLYILPSSSRIQLVRVISGAVTSLANITTVPMSAGTDYCLHITRGAGGAFTIWIEGGAYTEPTEILTATDLGVVESRRAVFDLERFDVIRDFEVLQGDMTPQEYDER